MGSGSWQRSRTGENEGYRHHCSKQSVSTPCSGLMEAEFPPREVETGQRRRPTQARERGMEAAQLPTVNYKTVDRSIESGRLPLRLREALMARLLAGEAPAGGQAEDGAAPDLA